MKSRLLTAAIGIPFAVVVLILGEIFHAVMYVVCALICAFMVIELLSAKKLHKKLFVLVPCVLFALAQPLLIPLNLGMFPTYVFLFLLFLSMLMFHERISFSDVAFSAIGVLAIVFGSSSILVVPNIIGKYYSLFFVMCLGIPWMADGGAYFAGVYLGRHKLCPKISPKKTVEGFFGGIVAGTVSAVIVGLIFGGLIFREIDFNYLTLLLLGALVSMASVVGDLSFSIIKRENGIKDYGSIFPGHGGFLDRFDSVLFSAPVVYFIASFLPLFVIK